MTSQQPPVTNKEYRALAEFRYHIRKYLDFSDRAAITAGIEPRQYQLLLAIKALADSTEPTVGTLAEQLHIRHHSAVELVNRAEGHGFVKRARLGDNKSYVFVSLTKEGERMLERAVTERLKELRVAGPALVHALKQLIGDDYKPKGKRI